MRRFDGAKSVDENFAINMSLDAEVASYDIKNADVVFARIRDFYHDISSVGVDHDVDVDVEGFFKW